MSPRALLLVPSLLALLASGCSHDPVPEAKIDALPEESGDPSENHRPGEPCVLCHDSYGGAEPELAVAGTLYGLDAAGKPAAAPNRYVVIIDSAGDFRGVCTNGAGNFFIKKEDWAEIAFPLTVQSGSSRMRSLIGRDGSCASCHHLPNADALIASTGASRDSAGVILVDVSQPDVNCGAL